MIDWWINMELVLELKSGDGGGGGVCWFILEIGINGDFFFE